MLVHDVATVVACVSDSITYSALFAVCLVWIWVVRAVVAGIEESVAVGIHLVLPHSEHRRADVALVTNAVTTAQFAIFLRFVRTVATVIEVVWHKVAILVGAEIFLNNVHYPPTEMRHIKINGNVWPGSQPASQRPDNRLQI